MANNRGGKSILFKKGINAKGTLITGGKTAVIHENAVQGRELPKIDMSGYAEATSDDVSKITVCGEVTAGDARVGTDHTVKVSYTSANAQGAKGAPYNGPLMNLPGPGPGVPVIEQIPHGPEQLENQFGVSSFSEEDFKISDPTDAGIPQDNSESVYHDAVATVPKVEDNSIQAPRQESSLEISYASDEASSQLGQPPSQLGSHSTANISEGRKSFHRRVQKPTESVVQYSEELKKLVDRCNFPNPDAELLEQFIEGLHNSGIQSKLKRRPNLNFDRAVGIAEGMEESGYA